jgi:DNA repair protein RadC
LGASAIIVAHNHPSGDTDPSIEDIKITERLKDGAEILGLSLLDHLIVTDDDCLSLAEKGLI